ncbi:MAG TPA: glycosyltransferase family 39 protein [Gemmatimonadales bacterium]|nr:glycosyltransferase family 39 protein [Gemmatimonadales bacterium]
MTFPDSAGTRDSPDAAVSSLYPRSRGRDFSSLRRIPPASLLLALSGCVLFSAALAFTALGTRPLVSPGEARYALIAREMLESGDWIQPRLNRVRYYEKPPLLYWCVAFAYRLFGQNEMASRLPSAAAYVATVAVTFFLARELLGGSAAPLAALIFATSPGPFLYGRFLSTETLFVLWLTVSLLGLAPAAKGHRGLLGPLLFWGGLSLAGLTKGFVGLVFPLGTAAICSFIVGPKSLARNLRPLLGTAIVALVFVPWHLLLSARDSDFLRFYVVNEHVLRFFNAREPLDYVSLSVGGFWLATALWFLPWSLFLPAALGSADLRSRLVIPLAWSAWVLLFFTVSAARLERYSLPMFPALAVVIAAYWGKMIDARRSASAGVRIPAWVVLGAGVALLLSLVIFRDSAVELIISLMTLLDSVYREYFASHPEASVIAARQCLRLVWPFGVLVFLLGVASLLASRLPRPRLGFSIWLAGALGLVWFFELGHDLAAPDLSQRDLAPIIRELWEPEAHLVVWGTYEDYSGVSFYTPYPIRVLDGAGGDLLFGYRKGDAPGLFLTNEEFKQLWTASSRVLVVGDRGLNIPGAILLAEGPRSVLVTNRPRSRPTAPLSNGPEEAR